MTSDEKGDQWFLQPPPPAGADPNQQASGPPPQQNQQSPNSTNPFHKLVQSPPPLDGSAQAGPQPGYGQQPYPPNQESVYPSPQQGSPFPQQQGGPYLPPQYPPPQYTSQQGSPYPQQGSPYPQQANSPPQQQGPYPPQQNVYAQSGPYTPQQQGSPYPQQGYPQQSQSPDPNSQVGGEASSFYGSGPPPVIQPGQGPGGPGDRGFFDNAMQMAGVQQPPPGPDGSERGWFSSSKNPLDPPPKMFKRPAPAHYSYVKFQPVSVLAISEKLQDGFALIPPVVAPGDQHPFVSHDITEDDWHKFLKDFQKTAHLSPSDRLFQGMANSFVKDKIPSAKVQKRMAENKLEPIGDYLIAWNHYFFHPRRMSVVLARGDRRFSGETDDYPPDITRHTKKSSKEKKSYSSSRSVDGPSTTIAEPYPRGSLIGGLLNPLHRAIHETTVAVVRAPGDLLSGVRPGERAGLSDRGPNSRSRGLRDSDEESDSEEYTDSEEESDDDDDDSPTRRFEKKAERDMAVAHRRAEEDLRAAHGLFRSSGEDSDHDPIRALQRKTERDMATAHRKAERDLEAFHNKAAADRRALLGSFGARRAERHARFEERRAERRSRRDERRSGRGRFGQGFEEEKPKKSKKHRKDKESAEDIPTGRFRLVLCYWDGQREVF